jgi:hypothetical protein
MRRKEKEMGKKLRLGFLLLSKYSDFQREIPWEVSK